MRKLIHIDSSAVYDLKAQRMMTILFGLADDGTSWVFKSEEPKWKQIPSIPQDKEMPKP